VNATDFPRISEQLLGAVRALPGAATTASDVLDELTLSLAVPAELVRPRVVRGVVAGHVVTAAFAPERRALSNVGLRDEPSALGHDRILAVAKPGDVLVFDARDAGPVSLLGGLAASAAKKQNISACLVDGGVRDLNELDAIGLPVWSRTLTPRTGRWRVELVQVNYPVVFGGVQVHAGDVTVADETGICFFPNAVAEGGLRRLLEIAALEQGQLGT
jgi:regulator of RNase E activity RraA